MRLPKKGRRLARSDPPRDDRKAPSSSPGAPVAEFREMAGWPFAQKRLGPDYFKQVYGREKCGADYAIAWLREHGLIEHVEAQELVHYLQAVDAFLFYDGVDIMNSSACEVLARRCIAIERTYSSNCASSSGSPDFFALYDISSRPSAARVPAADKTVMKQLAFDASMARLLARLAARDESAEDFDSAFEFGA